MKRYLPSLTEREFDVIIVGAGIFGVCAAWDAALRGLSVAIVEKNDFCSATSANHYKLVHGGIRYLQHGDLYRVHESCYERSALLRIAPHLVQPLPIVIPTYGYGVKGKWFLRAGFQAYDLLTFNRNYGISDPERLIPNSSFISRNEILNLFPGLNKNNLTGGGIFYDGQYYNPPRLALSFLRSAVTEGAVAANYLEVVDVLLRQNNVFGIKVKDLFTGEQFEILSKVVLITAGPWSHRLLESRVKIQLNPRPTFSRDLAFVVRKRLSNKYSLACSIKASDKDALMDRGGRHIFLSPWRDYTLVGAWHEIFNRSPDEVTVSTNELQEFLDDVNTAYPDLALSLQDVSMINTGLTLFGDENKQGKGKMSFGKRSQLIDHNNDHQIEGLVTLIGVRATTARGMAEKAVDLILKKLKKKVSKTKTTTTPIYGGQFACFKDLLSHVRGQNHYHFNDKTLHSLAHNYGSQYKEVLKYINEDQTWAETIEDSAVIKAEVIHAIREEMAQKLEDVIFRRTDLGTGGSPGEEAIKSCVKLMAKELDWSKEKTHTELVQVKNTFQKRGFLK